jgi:hypothetical protein
MTMKRSFSGLAILALALTATAPRAMAQTPATSLPWCGIVDGDLDCVYPTLQECERWMRPEGQECAPNPGSELDD